MRKAIMAILLMTMTLIMASCAKDQSMLATTSEIEGGVGVGGGIDSKIAPITWTEEGSFDVYDSCREELVTLNNRTTYSLVSSYDEKKGYYQNFSFDMVGVGVGQVTGIVYKGEGKHRSSISSSSPFADSEDVRGKSTMRLEYKSETEEEIVIEDNGHVIRKGNEYKLLKLTGWTVTCK